MPLAYLTLRAGISYSRVIYALLLEQESNYQQRRSTASSGICSKTDLARLGGNPES